MRNPRIRQWIEDSIDPEFELRSRVHRLPSELGANVFIKREDELSSGISGSKLRKYASLAKSFRDRGVEEAILIGGPNSNNLVGLVQILRERGIRPWLFIRQAGDATLRGNAQFLDMLVSAESIRWIRRAEWSSVELDAAAFAAERTGLGKAVAVVPEGGLAFESLAGAMTLAADLLRNETDRDETFRRIFVDSGTGMSAIGLVLGLAALCEPREREIVVTLVGGNEAEFRSNLARFETELRIRFPDTELRLSELQLRFVRPPICPSFGSFSAQLMAATRQIARDEGLLMEPIYSVKHYLAMKALIALEPLPVPTLFIYNGGSLGLAGFMYKLGPTHLGS